MKNKFYITLTIALLLFTRVFAEDIQSEPRDIPSEVVSEIIDEHTEEDNQEQPIIESIITTQDQETVIDPVVVDATSTTPNSNPADTEINSKESIRVFIRNGTSVVLDTHIDSNEEDTISVIDMNGSSHQISSQSALAYLIKADNASDSFNITKLQYFDGFGSFYLKCVSISGIEYCDNWQYLVNGFSPWTGIDQTPVNSDDMLAIYFGNPYQVVFNTNQFFEGIPFIATAQQYEYQTGTWLPRTNVTLGITVPNPNDPWSPLELVTTPVDVLGNAAFTIATSGEYMIGVQDDYYYPTYTITVSATTTATSTTSGGGSSNKKEFDLPAAIEFITNNGKYGGFDLSAWVAIAFSSAGYDDSSLYNYVKSNAKITNTLTDNERQAMAILALGENPYDFKNLNFVEAILKKFDGTQFGEKSLVNDDIFALIVLSKAGYTSNDIEVQKTIEFIKNNSTWKSDPDYSAAVIMALYPYKNVSGVSSIITSAKNYLKERQQNNGGWKNSRGEESVSTTSWVAQAMYELNENWVKDGKSVQDYFVDFQQKNGSMIEFGQENIMATSYVIPAVLEKSWNDILIAVPKEVSVSASTSGGNNSTEVSTSTIATSTLIVTSPITEETGTTTQLVKTDILELKDNTFVKNKVIQEQEENLEKEISTSTVQKVVDESQLASVQNIPLVKKWIAYALVIFFVFAGVGYIVVHKK